MKSSHILSIVIVLVLLVAAGALAFVTLNKKQPATTVTTATTTTAVYSCAQGMLSAAFANDQVLLTLPDHTTLTLPHTISGSGFRYENDSASFVGKGDTATLTQNGTVTFNDCLAGTHATTGNAGDTNAGTKTFTDTGNTFKFSYPSMFSVTGSTEGYTNNWSSGSLQTGLILAQIQIPSSFEPKTNFAGARFSIGTSADPTAVKNCLVQTNGNGVQSTKVTINGVAYTKLTYGDAGAGNFYDTMSYRTVRNNQCYAVEYTIHSTNIGNYSPDQGISQFDKVKIQNLMEGIVQSVRFL